MSKWLNKFTSNSRDSDSNSFLNSCKTLLVLVFCVEMSDTSDNCRRGDVNREERKKKDLETSKSLNSDHKDRERDRKEVSLDERIKEIEIERGKSLNLQSKISKILKLKKISCMNFFFFIRNG